MTNYIELNRGFRRVTEADDAHPEELAELQDWSDFGTLRWSHLLELPRVVLLAEAGSGKTWEMEARRDLLCGEGKAAFFLPLEALAQEGTDCLSVDEEREFQLWLGDDAAPGWFFLDSVDELKLTKAKFRTALNRFAKAIYGHLALAHVIVSSRPSDWLPMQDLATFEQLLPWVPEARESPSPVDAFLAPLRRSSIDDSEQEEAQDQSPALVSLLALSRSQVEAFVREKGVDPPSTFLAEVERRNAWSFTTRPLDLDELLSFWQANGRLGTRREQHEANIATKLRDDPARPDGGALTEADARTGAERLALAMALGRKRQIRSPDRGTQADATDGALDPAEVLPDWTPDQRGSLLRRALFDPATYGRVRFHHRSVQEYLAARRLEHLRDKGMCTDALFRLLLAERYATRVVIPSLAPITAWCALWSPDIRREILNRQPELLIEYGDPESLPVEERATLLRRFADTYEEGATRGLGFDRESVLRLADPGLSPVIRELWEKRSANGDVVDLLLKLIWQGRLSTCSDIAAEAAFDVGLGPYPRILAIWALAAVDARRDLRRVALALLGRRKGWPDRLLFAAVPELFPHSISVDELVTPVDATLVLSCSLLALFGRASGHRHAWRCSLAMHRAGVAHRRRLKQRATSRFRWHAAQGLLLPNRRRSLWQDERKGLVERVPEPEQSFSNFRYAMRGIALEVEPGSNEASALRDRLALLIWQGRGPHSNAYELQSRFAHLCPALAILCARQLAAGTRSEDLSNVLCCAVIAHRFLGHHDSTAEQDFAELEAWIANDRASRQIAFWCDVELFSALAPDASALALWWEVSLHRPFVPIDESDRPWLLAVLGDPSAAETQRGVALEALCRPRLPEGRAEGALSDLQDKVKDDPWLSDRLAEICAPPRPDPAIERFEQERRDHSRRARTKEDKRIAEWRHWRDEICADPQIAFSGGRRVSDISNLHAWLMNHSGSMSSRSYWNESAVVGAFGPEVAGAARKAFIDYWRTETPKLWSQKPEKERNSCNYSLLWGLTGVYVEASTDGWSRKLSPDESGLAARFATVEINGFPAWLAALCETHPEEVDQTLGAELAAQFAMVANPGEVPMLQDVAHAPVEVKRLFAGRLLDGLLAWPATNEDEKRAGRACYAIGLLLRTLTEVGSATVQATIADECGRRIRADQSGKLARCWLRGLMRLDIGLGVDLLEEMIAATPADMRTNHALELLVAVFHERDEMSFEGLEATVLIPALVRLIRLAYGCVAPKDDQRHEGTFTPDTRDHAQRVRGSLLNALLGTPGPQANQAIRELAEDPALTEREDWLRLQARNHAARDAEPDGMPMASIRALEQRLESSPRDRDGLFEVMMDRLEDIQHELAHGDFSTRRTLRTINDEKEMQRELAHRLEVAARGAYSVVREEEVTDLKEPDIRLRTPRNEHRAAIEIKIADRSGAGWTIKELEEALETQLVGQYLRADTGRAGCLLLTFAGSPSLTIRDAEFL
mgnify:CR=1 FL=1